MSSGLIRWCGLAATLGGVLGIVLTPILTYLWATYSDVYGYFGRAYFLVFLGCLVGLAGLYARRRANSGLRGTEELEMERLALGMTFVGLAIALVRLHPRLLGRRFRRRLHSGTDYGLRPRDDRDSAGAVRFVVARPHLPTHERIA